MNKLLFIAITLLVTTSSMHAYNYRVFNATNKNLYVDLIKYNPFGKNSSFFEGNSSASDSWKLQGPQLIKAGEMQKYNFVGIWWCDTVKVGTSNNSMPDVIIFAAGKGDFTSLSNNINNLRNTTATNVPCTKYQPGAQKCITFGGKMLGSNRHDLGGNISFIIGEMDNGSLFAIVTDYAE